MKRIFFWFVFKVVYEMMIYFFWSLFCEMLECEEEGRPRFSHVYIEEG